MTRSDAPAGRGTRFSRAAAFFLALALPLAGCASGSGGDGQDTAPRRDSYRDNPVRVEVKNHNWRAVHVYVVAGGQIQSLGQLASQQTDTYDIPASVLGTRDEIRLLADPIGSSDGTLSGPVLIRPGDLIQWTLTQPLTHSHVFIK